VRFTIGQLMILIAVVGLLLGIAAAALSNPGLVLLVASVPLIVLGPIGLQLYAIFWRDTPEPDKPSVCDGRIREDVDDRAHGAQAMRLPRLTKRRWMVAVAVAGLLLGGLAWFSILVVMVLALAGCSEGSGPPVRIIVPRDYRGEFLIVEAPEGSEIPLREGAYVCLIPRDGKLLVTTLHPFEQWHIESIAFDDGSMPKRYDHPAHAKPDEFAVFGGHIVKSDGSRPTMYFFVGTAKQAAEVF
jgi:hypothetical protein